MWPESRRSVVCDVLPLPWRWDDVCAQGDWKREGMAEAPSYEFGVSEFTTRPWSFEQDVDMYPQLGVQAIEIAEVKADAARVIEQRQEAQRRGMAISSVQPTVRTLFPSQSQPEPKDVPDRMARFRQTIERFSSAAQGVPFITNTGIAPNGNAAHVLEVAVREYRALADFASDHGVRVCLEPLNPSIMNVESTIWTLRQAMDVVRAVDRENFGICLDLWNIFQNADVEAEIRACGDRTFIVHVADWRTPRSYQDRHIPGQGEIPLPRLLRAIHESGYRGPYVVEIFSAGVPNALWEGDLSQLIRDSKAGLFEAWRKAFAD
jgi:sugar phosphate isomerase/epimerase